ncbi:MAG: coenzyme F420-0:L-glutamate ligase [Chloroflexi bacterium]|nr:coenzyme F420-0:L-glutamate ligase [Chloroflexota bacterium]
MSSTEAVTLTATALPGLPLVQPGDNLVEIILAGVARAGLTLQTGDALVIASKIVSKSEGRFVDLYTVQPTSEAQRLATETHKDARIVQLVLDESRALSRTAPGVLVVTHRLGFTSANAGIDQSNVEHGDTRVLLLPHDPDASAQRIRQGLRAAAGVDVGVIISDSHGRPFRVGNVGVAIGVAGMPAVLDLRGRPDLFGRHLKISIQAYADLVASAAHLLTGEADEGRPVVLLRGLRFAPLAGTAAELNRPPEMDLYR